MADCETRYDVNILEEELKNKVAHDLFPDFDTTQIIGHVDFCVSLPTDPLGLNETEPLLWAEAKKGTTHPIDESFIQLILTLGKERPQDRILPPPFLGAFDAEKMAFLPYNTILDVLRQNDFNWNVAPSDHSTKEFQQLKALLADTLNNGLVVYRYNEDAQELAHFILHKFARRRLESSHIRITKNNFTHIYLKWLDAVKPTININWDAAKRAGIIDADFYLADILSKENHTLGEKLFVLLQNDHYLLDRKVDDTGLEEYKKALFTDNQRAHSQFWNRYARPPRREYWDDIVNRRDLLVPQDVRERKGSFFTPARWVELSQQYIAAELGENWQEEYYVWDCCAGTGNLLAGLTNKYNIYASTLDKADVQAMYQRIDAMNRAARGIDHANDEIKEQSRAQNNMLLQYPHEGGKRMEKITASGSNLLESHVFQFDFLNDPLLDVVDKSGKVITPSKLPKSLQDIIRDPEKRKKLVIYINPPYAEASNARTAAGTGTNRKGLSKTKIQEQYKKLLGRAANELFAQFFARVVSEIPTCVLAPFSTLKMVQAPNFTEFRKTFRALPGRFFLVPANTFDNVTGEFPIAFQIWKTSTTDFFHEVIADVYDAKGQFIGKKTLFSYSMDIVINRWLHNHYDNIGKQIGWLRFVPNDFQNNRGVYITSKAKDSDIRESRVAKISINNVLIITMYFSVRLSMESNWLNDRDQFLYPNNGWRTDHEFQTDCLVYTLFHGQNRISSEHGVNHWIPFTEDEVGAQEKYESHFLTDFISGKQRPEAFSASPTQGELFANDAPVAPSVIDLPKPLPFSPEAQSVMDAARTLYRYFHRQPGANANASFYDIRLYFQGTRTLPNGRVQMNAESEDPTYSSLLATLRESMKTLARHIESKVYAYGFLKR